MLNLTIKIKSIITIYFFAINNFANYYFVGLLNGDLEYGEIPRQVYEGLFVGIIVAFIFWGISLLFARLISLITKKKTEGSKIFLIITLLFFCLTVLSQRKNVYHALTIDKKDVEILQQKISTIRQHK